VSCRGGAVKEDGVEARRDPGSAQAYVEIRDDEECSTKVSFSSEIINSLSNAIQEQPTPLYMTISKSLHGEHSGTAENQTRRQDSNEATLSVERRRRGTTCCATCSSGLSLSGDCACFTRRGGICGHLDLWARDSISADDGISRIRLLLAHLLHRWHPRVSAVASEEIRIDRSGSSKSTNAVHLGFRTSSRFVPLDHAIGQHCQWRLPAMSFTLSGLQDLATTCQIAMRDQRCCTHW
jgi:hypothetical protein